MPPRICARGRATSRRASSRFARRPTARSRRIRTSSTSSGAACPTPRCRPGPTSPTRKCRISRTSSRRSRPTSRSPRMSRQPVPLPSAPKATKESIELGKKLYEENGCVKCHGTLGRGDGPSAPTLMDDWGHPIRAGGPRAELDLPGRLVPRGYLPDDEHRAQRHAHAVVRRRAHARAAMGDHRLHRLALGERRARLCQPRRRQARQDPIDLAKGAASFASAPVARFPIIGQIMEPGRSFHPPATSVTVQAIYDADSIALLVRWHDMSAREDREERAVASRAAGGGGGAGGWCTAAGGAQRRTRLATRKSRRRRPGSAPDPFAEADAPAAPASEFSDAVAIQIPSQVPTGARKPYFIFGDAQNSVDLWFFDLARPESAAVHRQGKRGHRAQRHGRSHRCRELRPGGMVGHLQAAASRRLGRRVHARRVHAGRLLGLGRVLARAWQPARSHALVLPLRRARSGPIGRRPDGEDGAAHSRHRAGRDRLGAVAARLSRPRRARR